MDTINSIINFFNKEVFTAFSNISSIAGLIISIFVFMRVKRIERNYAFRIRVPALASELERQALRLNDYLNDYQNYISDIKEVLAKSEVHLESLREKVDRHTRESIKSLLREIHSYSESQEHLAQLSHIKSLLHRVGLYRLSNAEQEELKGERKQEDVRRIYVSMLKMTTKLSNIQEDRRLE